MIETTLPRDEPEAGPGAGPDARRTGRVPALLGSAVRVAFLTSALVHPLAWLLSRWLWLADLLCHFREVGLGLTLAALALHLPRRRRVAAALAALAALQAAPLFADLGPNPVAPDPRSPERLRILAANVLYKNRSFDDLAALIRAERPDVVALVEYTARCGRALRAVRDEFPARFEVPSGPSGLAVWFRRPPLAFDPPIFLVPDRNGILHATFEFAGRPRNLWVVHPTSPFWRFGEPGNPETEAIASWVALAGGSSVVVGDMNTTDASAHFRDFLRISGLRDSRLGFGRQPSWPAFSPYRIAIDHALVSDDLAVVDRRIGPDVGSDHLPVIVDLAPAAPARSAATSSAAR